MYIVQMDHIRLIFVDVSLHPLRAPSRGKSMFSFEEGRKHMPDHLRPAAELHGLHIRRSLPAPVEDAALMAVLLKHMPNIRRYSAHTSVAADGIYL